MSKASEYVKKAFPLEFKDDQDCKVAEVGWYMPEANIPVPTLDLNAKRKGMLSAEEAVKFGRWLLDTFGEPENGPLSLRP